MKRVFWFSLQILFEAFLILIKTERYMIKNCILVFMQIILYSCRFLMKLEFCQQIFEK